VHEMARLSRTVGARSTLDSMSILWIADWFIKYIVSHEKRE